jgi:hypothetical protein
LASSFFGSAEGAMLLEDDELGAVLLEDELGAMLLDDEELGVMLLELDVELEVSGALVASLDALGAGAVGAGEAVDVLEELDAGLVAGGVATVLDFCSVHAATASVRAATARMVLYMLDSLVK